MIKMTSRERIATAARGEEPDRVPVVVPLSLGWAWGQLYGPDSFMEFGCDAKKMAKVMVWSCKELGMDATPGGADTHMYFEAIAEASGISYPTTNWKDFVTSHPHRLFEGDPLTAPLYGDPLVKTMKDARKLVPADPYKHGKLPIVLEAQQLAKRELKDGWGISGSINRPYGIAGDLMGYAQAFMAMEKDLELWKTVEDVAIKTSYEFAKAQIKAGVTSLGTTASLACFVGSKMFLEKPVWVHAEHPPELMERVFKEFHVGTVLHPCSVGPFEPGIEAWKKWLDHTPGFLMPECGGADALARAKEQLAPAVMQGNIHSVDIMLHGTPGEVEAACKELIKKCAPGGRYVLAPGCALPLGVPMENVKAMRDSVEKYGQYPIKVKEL